jgi:hypothetical protein
MKIISMMQAEHLLSAVLSVLSWRSLAPRFLPRSDDVAASQGTREQVSSGYHGRRWDTAALALHQTTGHAFVANMHDNTVSIPDVNRQVVHHNSHRVVAATGLPLWCLVVLRSEAAEAKRHHRAGSSHVPS